MQPRSLEKRVEILESRVTALEELPARVEALEQQFLQHREETRAAFSANAAEHALFRTELKAFRDDVAKEFVQVRKEIRDGDQETRLQMRVLHEDVIERIARLGEAQEETDLHLGGLRGEVGELRGEVGELRSEVHGLRTQITDGFATLGDRIDSLITVERPAAAPRSQTRRKR